MEINLIFKIAAVGIIISILNQILKHSGRDSIHIRTVYNYAEIV